MIMDRTQPSVPIDLRTPMGRLRIASRVEGVTLITLVGVAVPLKYLGGEPGFVGLMGPVHGVAFVAYLLMLAEATAAGGWRVGEVVRTAVLTVIPFGPFLNDGFLARKAAAIAQAEVQP
jgi:integral membrane protein